MNFEVGDRVVDLTYGYGNVIRVLNDEAEDYPVVVKLDAFSQISPKMTKQYTMDGRYNKQEFVPSLYHAEGFTPPSCDEPERKIECPFKPFDKVLVRDEDNQKWRPNFFYYYNDKVRDFRYVMINGDAFAQCISYEGNEDKVRKAY